MPPLAITSLLPWQETYAIECHPVRYRVVDEKALSLWERQGGVPPYIRQALNSLWLSSGWKILHNFQLLLLYIL